MSDRMFKVWAVSLWTSAALMSILVISGCATAGSAKDKIAKDLAEIVEYQDCPTICDALKAYIRTQLGVNIDEDTGEEQAVVAK